MTFRWAMLAPVLTITGVAVGFPLGYALYLSLTDYRLTSRGTPDFVGLENYLFVLTDPRMWNAFSNTAVYVIVAVMLLDIGKVRIVVDTLAEGVDVPAQLRGQRDLHLNLSHLFRLDVFEVGPLAVRASLSFGGERYLCVLPWACIYLIAGNGLTEQVAYPEDAPEAARRQVEQLAASQSQAPAPQPAPLPPEAAQPVEPTDDDEPPKPRLRLVKP